MPAPLHQLYAFCYNWPREQSLANGIPLLSVQNYLSLQPVTHETDERIPPGLVCFANENQGVTRWATLLEGDDPPVYGRDYEDDEIYQSPDGEYHGSWRKLHTPLTDFLIGYVLNELVLSSTSGTLTPLIEHLEAKPEALSPLVTWVLGYPRKISLYEDNILVVQAAQWNKPDLWQFVVRDGAAQARLSPFSGTLINAGFEVIEDALEDQKPRKWHVYFNRDGSGALSSARSPRFLSRDNMPIGAMSLDAIVAEIEATGRREASPDSPMRVQISREDVSSVWGFRSSAEYWVPKSFIRELFQQALDAIEDPSLALMEQLEVGSPLD
ncbi:MAG: hypothetical protein AB8G95_13965 [Anaerolineae bacterium]